MIYHDPSKGLRPITIRIDVDPRPLRRLGDSLRRMADVLEGNRVLQEVWGRFGDEVRATVATTLGNPPQLRYAWLWRYVHDELVPLMRAAAALDGGYRSLPKRIPLPATPVRFATVEHQADPPVVDELSTSFTVPVSGWWSFWSGPGRRDQGR